METMGVVVRSYIDFLILLISTPLVYALFAASQLFVKFLKCFSFLYNNLVRETQLKYFPSPLSNNFIEFTYHTSLSLSILFTFLL